MRRLLLSVLLVALLLTTAGVVYAGVSWGDDPPVGCGVWLATTVTAEPSDGDWEPEVKHKVRKAECDDDGETEVEVKVWVKNYSKKKDKFSCTLEARLTDGEGGSTLATKSKPCHKRVTVKWESDD